MITFEHLFQIINNFFQFPFEFIIPFRSNQNYLLLFNPLLSNRFYLSHTAITKETIFSENDI